MRVTRLSHLLVVALVIAGCGRKPCDEDNRGPSARLDVSLGTCNYKPIAKVKATSIVVHKHEPVELDGTLSSDLNLDPISYSWRLARQPEGSTAGIENATDATATFTPSLAGTYVAELVVSDGELMSEGDEVRVTVLNTTPIADAGDDFTIPVGMTATLDASRSVDPDGDPFTYRWEFVRVPDGSGATLDDPTSIRPSFVADVYGVFELALVVDDGESTSEPDTMLVGAGIVGGPPTANAGADIQSVTGLPLTLSGAASMDPDGDPITYEWSLIEAPDTNGVTFAGNGPNASFIASVEGRYVVQLTVNDGFYTSDPDTVAIDLTYGTGISGDECAAAGCAQGYGCISAVCVGVGLLRFSLTWDAISDFDIHVVTPSGTEIFYGNPMADGGELDVDDCVGNACLMPTGHVENVVFFQTPPTGRYQFWVENFNGGAAGTFTLEAAGAVNRVVTDSLPATTGISSRRYEVIVQ